MFSAPFYHSATRNLVIAFGQLFNNISVVRKQTDGAEYERFKVPLEYGPKQKWWVVMKEEATNLKRVRVKLPRMSFEIVNMTPDNPQQLNPIHQLVRSVDGDYQVAYAPVRYTYVFELNIMTQNADDGFQIIEQILPYFAPTYTVSVNTLPGLDQVDNIPITLAAFNKVDDYEGSFEQLRLQTWSLVFNVRSTIYGPVSEAKLIKKAIVDIHNVGGSGPVTDKEVERTPRHVRIITEPDPLNADPNDDFGFSISITEYDDSKKRDPVTGNDVSVGYDVTATTLPVSATTSVPAPDVSTD